MRRFFAVTTLLSMAAVGSTVLAPGALAASGWTVSAAPTAPGRTDAVLVSVACPSATLCVGVNTGTPQAVVVTDGVPSAAALSLPSNANASAANSLSAIACFSATSCVAVGAYHTNAGRQRPLFETYTAGDHFRQIASL